MYSPLSLVRLEKSRIFLKKGDRESTSKRVTME